MDRDLSHAYPPLATKAVLIQDAYQISYPNRQLIVTGVWRSTAEQQALFAEGRTTPGPGASLTNPLGRTVTADDGVIHLSKHQGVDPKGNPCALAVDFGVLVGGKYMTDDGYCLPLQALAHKQGLVSGWDFPHLGGRSVDPPHVQWVGPTDFGYLNTPPTSDSTAI